METRGGFLRNKALPAALFLLIQLILALPGQAETTYNDVSRSITGAFEGTQNVIGIIVLSLVGVLAVAAFRISWRKEKESEKKVPAKIRLRPLGPKQNRKWYRMKFSMEFEWIPATMAEKAQQKHYKTGRLVDISGGGLCFKTAEEINAGDEILLFLDIGEKKPMVINGKVLRAEKETGRNSALFKVSLEFLRLLRGERDRIISFITKRQRSVVGESMEEG